MTNDEMNLFDATQGFSVKEYWDSRYRQGGNSGAGSYGEESFMKAHVINYWINQLGLHTIFEVGSGDANNLLMYKVPISYYGYDLSQKAVEIGREKTRKISNSLKYYFDTKFDLNDTEVDLCLCLDVWYHQINDKDFDDLCKLLFVDGKWKYIVIYSTDTNSQFTETGEPLSQHVRFREVLSKVKEFPEWEVLYCLSDVNVTETQSKNFPANKKFFLLRNINKN
jgi:SAM-dependent methyltransferase